MTILITTPTTDWQIGYSVNAAGQTVVSLALTPANDLALVTGIQRLVQDLTRALMTPKGMDPLKPRYGNALWDEVGAPFEIDPQTYVGIVQQFGEDFIADQQDAAARGYLTTDELVDHFQSITVTPDYVALTLTVSIVVVAKSGTAATVNVALQ